MAYRGDPRQKQVQSVRPILLSDDSAPACEVTVRYDFDMTEPAEPTEPAGSPGSWDYGLVTGTLAGGAFQPQVNLSVAITSEASFPAAGGVVDISDNELNVGYDTYDGSEMGLTDPTSVDHFIGEVVTLRSPPDDDTGTWDTATWGGEQLPSTTLRGATGMGRDLALAIRGASYARTTLVGVDVLFTVGGPL